MPNLYFAPIQGHTDAAYRHFHAQKYGGNLTYYTPFIRYEKEGLRNKDIKDFSSSLNENINLVPQIIFRDEKELNSLISDLKNRGFKEIDLNMGCPFPLQTGHGRGAATISNEYLASKVIEAVRTNPEINFSVKMRLGLKDPKEWQKLLPYLNTIDLRHITLHPRIAFQQYTGEVNMEEFAEFYKESKNKVVYNGDLKSLEDIELIQRKFPSLKDFMIARGALGRPSIFNEISEKKDWDKERRLSEMLDFHKRLFCHYSSVLCGDTQIISKIKPFWEYAEEEIGRKAWKSIKKATNLSKYQTAVASI